MDDPLLQEARTGSREAQSALLRAMQDDWYRFCLSQLGGGRHAGRPAGEAAHLAEDATQETALRVLRSLKTFDGRSSFKTWSFGIALNVCREIRRRRAIQHRRTSSLDPATVDLGDAGDPFAAIDQAMTSAVQTAALRTALNELPDRQREVVTLRYLESLSVADTALAMNCAAGTVKASLFAALRTLRKRLSSVHHE